MDYETELEFPVVGEDILYVYKGEVVIIRVLGVSKEYVETENYLIKWASREGSSMTISYLPLIMRELHECRFLRWVR